MTGKSNMLAKWSEKKASALSTSVTWRTCGYMGHSDLVEEFSQ